MALVKTLDSYDSPTPDQLNKAWKDGVRAWNGYLYVKGWSKASFDAIRARGMQGIAYANGNDDPVKMKALAASWGVRGCLDVERGTRANGTWVEAWLEASGFGLYASQSGYPHNSALFHVIAAYQSTDPKASWPSGPPKPPTPLGWQWAGNLTVYDAHVDRSWFDSDVFAPTPTPTPPPYTGIAENEMFSIINRTDGLGAYVWQDSNGNLVHINNPDDLAQLAALKNCGGEAKVTVQTYQALAAAAPNLKPVPASETDAKATESA